MNVEIFEIGTFATNCYFLTEENSIGLIVDPAAPSDILNKRIEEFGFNKIKYILLTHGHFDHIGYADMLRKKTGAKIVIYKGEEKFLRNSALNMSSFISGMKIAPFDADIIVGDEDKIPFGEKSIEVIHTPGHTSGSCCYIIDNIFFSGDTLMSGSMGRTDFPTGDYDEIMESLRKIKNLKGNYKVYCGHGSETTLEYERKNNFFMKNL